MSEIEHILKDLGLQLSSKNMKSNIETILKAGDGDNDGNLSEKEFYKFYRKCLATEDKKASYKAKVISRYVKTNPSMAYLSGL